MAQAKAAKARAKMPTGPSAHELFILAFPERAARWEAEWDAEQEAKQTCQAPAPDKDTGRDLNKPKERK